MNKDELVAAIMALDPVSLREVFSKLARGFDQKAEHLYDENPEHNGVLAQPYSDLGDLCDSCSQVFEGPEAAMPVDTEAPVPQVEPVTVTAAVTRQVTSGNPWGRR